MIPEQDIKRGADAPLFEEQAAGVRILYEDETLLACVKPAGMDSEHALPAALAALGRPVRVVHRLDRDTAGVTVLARSREAAAALSAGIADGKDEKEYLAVLAGRPAERAGELRDLLFHDRAHNKTFVVDRMRRGVREAALVYRTLGETASQTLVHVRLLTGRTHQIRVQFASRGTPLVGDARYGGRAAAARTPALWSLAVTLTHPARGERIRFGALPPRTGVWADFDAALSSLGEGNADSVL